MFFDFIFWNVRNFLHVYNAVYYFVSSVCLFPALWTQATSQKINSKQSHFLSHTSKQELDHSICHHVSTGTKHGCPNKNNRRAPPPHRLGWPEWQLLLTKQTFGFPSFYMRSVHIPVTELPPCPDGTRADEGPFLTTSQCRLIQVQVPEGPCGCGVRSPSLKCHKPNLSATQQ